MHKDDYDHRLIVTIITTNPTQICCDVSILQYWFERETSLLQNELASVRFLPPLRDPASDLEAEV